MSLYLEEGAVVRGYRVTARLSSGGEGTAYRADSPSLGECVLKQHNFSASDPENKVELERCMRRKDLIGKRHACVAEIFDIFDEGDLAYEVSEYVKGTPLDVLLRERGPLPLSEAEPVFDCVLSGLGWLHKQDIVHRDIKPANIIGTPDGKAKLIDFGIILALKRRRLTERTPPCTPLYAPLEVMHGGDMVIDARSDLYMVGVALFETLTKAIPFPEEDEAMVEAKGAGRIASLREFVPEIPRAVDEFVTRLLQRDVDDRYASAEEARTALRRACELSKGSPHGPGPAALPAAPSTPRPPSVEFAMDRERLRHRPPIVDDLDSYTYEAASSPSLYPRPSVEESRFLPEDVSLHRREPEPKIEGPFVRVLDGSKAGTRIPIPPRGVCVGRAELNAEDTNISRIHARLVPKRDTLLVKAQNALNGMVVDEKRLKKTRLTRGQEFMMGMTRLRFENDGGR